MSFKKKKGHFHFKKIENFTKCRVKREEDNELYESLQTSRHDIVVTNQDIDSEADYGVLNVQQRRKRYTAQICIMKSIKVFGTLTNPT